MCWIFFLRLISLRQGLLRLFPTSRPFQRRGWGGFELKYWISIFEPSRMHYLNYCEMRPIWGHREFMDTDCHFTLKENNLHLTKTSPLCPFICYVTFVCFQTTGSLGWRHYLFLLCMVPNMLPVLKINSSNTGSLSHNLSPGNLYLIQESQFFSWHYLCYLGRDCANTFHVCENSPC